MINVKLDESHQRAGIIAVIIYIKAFSRHVFKHIIQEQPWVFMKRPYSVSQRHRDEGAFIDLSDPCAASKGFCMNIVLERQREETLL